MQASLRIRSARRVADVSNRQEGGRRFSLEDTANLQSSCELNVHPPLVHRFGSEGLDLPDDKEIRRLNGGDVRAGGHLNECQSSKDGLRNGTPHLLIVK